MKYTAANYSVISSGNVILNMDIFLSQLKNFVNYYNSYNEKYYYFWGKVVKE
jgi:hypothetical protein